MDDNNKKPADKKSSEIFIITPQELAKLGILDALSATISKPKDEKLLPSVASTEIYQRPVNKNSEAILKSIFSKKLSFKSSDKYVFKKPLEPGKSTEPNQSNPLKGGQSTSPRLRTKLTKARKKLVPIVCTTASETITSSLVLDKSQNKYKKVSILNNKLINSEKQELHNILPESSESSLNNSAQIKTQSIRTDPDFFSNTQMDISRDKKTKTYARKSLPSKNSIPTIDNIEVSKEILKTSTNQFKMPHQIFKSTNILETILTDPVEVNNEEEYKLTNEKSNVNVECVSSGTDVATKATMPKTETIKDKVLILENINIPKTVIDLSKFSSSICRNTNITSVTYMPTIYSKNVESKQVSGPENDALKKQIKNVDTKLNSGSTIQRRNSNVASQITTTSDKEYNANPGSETSVTEQVMEANENPVTCLKESKTVVEKGNVQYVLEEKLHDTDLSKLKKETFDNTEEKSEGILILNYTDIKMERPNDVDNSEKNTDIPSKAFPDLKQESNQQVSSPGETLKLRENLKRSQRKRSQSTRYSSSEWFTDEQEECDREQMEIFMDTPENEMDIYSNTLKNVHSNRVTENAFMTSHCVKINSPSTSKAVENWVNPQLHEINVVSKKEDEPKISNLKLDCMPVKKRKSRLVRKYISQHDTEIESKPSNSFSLKRIDNEHEQSKLLLNTHKPCQEVSTENRVQQSNRLTTLDAEDSFKKVSDHQPSQKDSCEKIILEKDIELLEIQTSIQPDRLSTQSENARTDNKTMGSQKDIKYIPYTPETPIKIAEELYIKRNPELFEYNQETTRKNFQNEAASIINSGTNSNVIETIETSSNIENIQIPEPLILSDTDTTNNLTKCGKKEEDKSLPIPICSSIVDNHHVYKHKTMPEADIFSKENIRTDNATSENDQPQKEIFDEHSNITVQVLNDSQEDGLQIDIQNLDIHIVDSIQNHIFNEEFENNVEITKIEDNKTKLECKDLLKEVAASQKALECGQITIPNEIDKQKENNSLTECSSLNHKNTDQCAGSAICKYDQQTHVDVSQKFSPSEIQDTSGMPSKQDHEGAKILQKDVFELGDKNITKGIFKKRSRRNRTPWRNNKMANFQTQEIVKNSGAQNEVNVSNIVALKQIEDSKTLGAQANKVDQSNSTDLKQIEDPKTPGAQENEVNNADLKQIEDPKLPDRPSQSFLSTDIQIEVTMEKSKRGRRHAKINYLELEELLDEFTIDGDKRGNLPVHQSSDGVVKKKRGRKPKLVTDPPVKNVELPELPISTKNIAEEARLEINSKSEESAFLKAVTEEGITTRVNMEKYSEKTYLTQINLNKADTDSKFLLNNVIHESSTSPKDQSDTINSETHVNTFLINHIEKNDESHVIAPDKDLKTETLKKKRGRPRKLPVNSLKEVDKIRETGVSCKNTNLIHEECHLSFTEENKSIISDESVKANEPTGSNIPKSVLNSTMDNDKSPDSSLNNFNILPKKNRGRSPQVSINSLKKVNKPEEDNTNFIPLLNADFSNKKDNSMSEEFNLLLTEENKSIIIDKCAKASDSTDKNIPESVLNDAMDIDKSPDSSLNNSVILPKKKRGRPPKISINYLKKVDKLEEENTNFIPLLNTEVSDKKDNSMCEEFNLSLTEVDKNINVYAKVNDPTDYNIPESAKVTLLNDTIDNSPDASLNDYIIIPKKKRGRPSKVLVFSDNQVDLQAENPKTQKVYENNYNVDSSLNIAAISINKETEGGKIATSLCEETIINSDVNIQETPKSKNPINSKIMKLQKNIESIDSNSLDDIINKSPFSLNDLNISHKRKRGRPPKISKHESVSEQEINLPLIEIGSSEANEIDISLDEKLSGTGNTGNCSISENNKQENPETSEAVTAFYEKNVKGKKNLTNLAKNTESCCTSSENTNQDKTVDFVSSDTDIFPKKEKGRPANIFKQMVSLFPDKRDLPIKSNILNKGKSKTFIHKNLNEATLLETLDGSKNEKQVQTKSEKEIPSSEKETEDSKVCLEESIKENNFENLDITDIDNDANVIGSTSVSNIINPNSISLDSLMSDSDIAPKKRRGRPPKISKQSETEHKHISVETIVTCSLEHATTSKYFRNNSTDISVLPNVTNEVVTETTGLIRKRGRKRKSYSCDSLSEVPTEQSRTVKEHLQITNLELDDSHHSKRKNQGNEELKALEKSVTDIYETALAAHHTNVKIEFPTDDPGNLKSEDTEECSTANITQRKTKIGRPKKDAVSFQVDDEGRVACGICQDKIDLVDWDDHNENRHHCLSWREGEPVVRLEQKHLVKRKLKPLLQKKSTLACLKCNCLLTKYKAYIEHKEECDGIVKNGEVICAICNESMVQNRWLQHKIKHNNLAWRIGDFPIDLSNESVVRVIITAFHKLKKSLQCEKCRVIKKSVVGFLSHQAQCGDKDNAKIACNLCGKKMLPPSLPIHISMVHEASNKTPTTVSKFFDVSQETPLGRRKAAENALARIDEFTTDHLETSKHCVKQMNFERNEALISYLNKEIQENKSIKCKIKGCMFASEDAEELIMHMGSCPIKPDQYFTCNKCFFVDSSEKELIKHLKRDHRLRMANDNDYVYNDDEVCDEYEINVMENQVKSQKQADIIVRRKPWFILQTSSKPDYRNILYSHAFQYTLDFCRQHYQEMNLFNTLTAEESEWNLVEDFLLEKYLPPSEISCDVLSKSVNGLENIYGLEYTFKKFELFEVDQDSAQTTIYCGAPVICLSWLPTPFTSLNKNQILAIGTGQNFDGKYTVNEKYSETTLIQFWNFGLLKNCQRWSKPKLDFCLAVDNGPIWQMEWCPSGCYNIDDSLGSCRIGLLAVAGCTMAVDIYSIPLLKTELMGLIYKTKPVLKLQLVKDDREMKRNIFPTRISWSKVSGHSDIAVGYTDGTVAIYNIADHISNILKFKDESSTDVLLPYKTIKAHAHFISALSLIPIDKGNRWLLTGSFDKLIHTWDLDNNDKYSIKKNRIVSDGAWLTNWLCHISTTDELTPGIGNISSRIQNHREYNYDNFTLSTSSTTLCSISASDWLNAMVNCNINGEINVCFPHQMLYDMGRIKKTANYRFLKGCAVLIDKSLSPEKRAEAEHLKNNKVKSAKSGNKSYSMAEYEEGDIFPTSYEPMDYKEATQQYGVVFCDLDKTQFDNDLIGEFSRLNLYPLQAINKICFNPNRQASLYFASGYQIGFVRLSYLSFLEEDEQIKKSEMCDT